MKSIWPCAWAFCSITKQIEVTEEKEDQHFTNNLAAQINIHQGLFSVTDYFHEHKGNNFFFNDSTKHNNVWERTYSISSHVRCFDSEHMLMLMLKEFANSFCNFKCLNELYTSLSDCKERKLHIKTILRGHNSIMRKNHGIWNSKQICYAKNKAIFCSLNK